MTRMNGSITVYRNWAPDGIVWTQWVKPVLFADEVVTSKINKSADDMFEVSVPQVDEESSVFEVKPPPIDWTASIPADAAVILDRPGKVGVEEAMTLARKGFRPVPLYNGVNGADRDNVNHHAVLVDSQKIAEALIKYADELSALGIDDDAPPVFMLDSNRMHGGEYLRDGVYDNRWRVFPQDMPSAAFLLKHGIKKVVLRTDCTEDDLEHILHRYHKKGLKIMACDKFGDIKEWRLPLLSRFFRSLSYRAKVCAGLKRNSAGGFGGKYVEFDTDAFFGSGG